MTLAKLLAQGQSGGEVVDKDDLWSCLFGKARRQTVLAGAAEVLGDGAGADEVNRYLRAEAATDRAGG